MADGSPNTACGKTAKSTSSEAAGATVTDSAENRASGDEARAERSPDVARNMNAEAPDETKCKTVGATMSEAASGATKEIASERVGDAPCEYKVFVRDYTQRARIGFLQTIFTGFWKNFKTKFNAKSGEAKWDYLTFLKMINLISTAPGRHFHRRRKL